MKTSHFAPLAAALALLGLAPAGHAGVANGNFSSGLASWSSAGNVAVDNTVNYGPLPAGLNAQALLGTAEAGSFLFGGSATGAATLDAFTGLPAGTLAGLGGVVGSALLQSITTGSGESLAFQWKFMTNEPQFNSPANDTAFLVIDGKLSTLTTVQTATLLGGTVATSPLFDETAYSLYTSAPLGAGSHTVAFGIIDIPDSLGASVLAVTGVAAVPEPGAWALMSSGLAVMTALSLRRRARS
jgi:hypothetical protein